MKNIKDLHRETIDSITIPSKTVSHATFESRFPDTVTVQGKGVLRRIEEVFDCWFESGSMPYAQKHYPFEHKVVNCFLQFGFTECIDCFRSALRLRSLRTSLLRVLTRLVDGSLHPSSACVVILNCFLQVLHADGAEHSAL